MVIVLFRSKLVDAPAGYHAMSEEMEQLVRTMPGFIEAQSYTSDAGERLTVVWWENAEGLKAWREHERHRVAQRVGRAQWYEYYKLDVAEVVRTTSFGRGQ